MITAPEPEPLLAVEGLEVSLGIPPVSAVRGVDFSMAAGEILAVAGESGSGKSVTALALCRLLPQRAQPTIRGKVRWDGQPQNLLLLREKALRSLRGNEIGYIFQEPSACFNPLFSIEAHFKEILGLQGVPRHAQPMAMEEALLAVGIEPDRKNLRALPAEFSGGMLQRAAIACALLSNPRLLIADEPTTALDASSQKRVVDLLGDLNASRKMAILFISHDLALLNAIAKRVLVMQAGQIVEEGPVSSVLHDPRHPYTRELVEALPKLQR